MIELGEGLFAPEAPSELEHLGLEPDFVTDLTLKLANVVPQFTTEWATEQICLPAQLVNEILGQMKDERLVEILGQTGPFSYKYAITQRGQERARRLIEFSAYVGPAPVSLDVYTDMLCWEADKFVPVTQENVDIALTDLVLAGSAAEIAALAMSSGRSLFLFGPAGNGKSSMARLLHRVAEGDIWIPHVIEVGGNVIRVFDPQFHEPTDDQIGRAFRIDRRWRRIRRPLVTAGGEMTIEEMDLVFSPSLRFYEAPPHVKANGGVFLLDDFGRQRIAPHELLNRWIIPLEHSIDYLTLASGQKVTMPFRLMLVVATNLTVGDVADPAFLRRMGYRLHLQPPDPPRFAEIFRAYARRVQVELPGGMVESVLERYAREGRDLRCSEPEALIERVRDICHLRGQPFHLDEQVLDSAWTGYFGNQ